MKTHYHVSENNLGATVVLKAQIPKSALVKREGSRPRVCFASTLEKCLASIQGDIKITVSETATVYLSRAGTKPINNPTVYATQKRLVTPPQDASDFADTQERWSVTDIEVKRVGYVCLRKLAFAHKVFLTKAPVCDINELELKGYLAHFNGSYKKLIKPTFRKPL